MSNRGGKRAGAGRPVGSKNQRSSEIAREAADAGITPIEVMLFAMRELWDEGTSEAKREAAKIAKDAAHYVHPRLACLDATIHEEQHFVIRAPEPCANPEPCATAEEWEQKYRPAGTPAD